MKQKQAPRVQVTTDDDTIELTVWARLYVQHLMTLEGIATIPVPLKAAS